MCNNTVYSLGTLSLTPFQHGVSEGSYSQPCFLPVQMNSQPCLLPDQANTVSLVSYLSRWIQSAFSLSYPGEYSHPCLLPVQVNTVILVSICLGERSQPCLLPVKMNAVSLVSYLSRATLSALSSTCPGEHRQPCLLPVQVNTVKHVSYLSKWTSALSPNCSGEQIQPCLLPVQVNTVSRISCLYKWIQSALSPTCPGEHSQPEEMNERSKQLTDSAGHTTLQAWNKFYQVHFHIPLSHFHKKVERLENFKNYGWKKNGEKKETKSKKWDRKR
jgi:hypothetical protein